MEVLFAKLKALKTDVNLTKKKFGFLPRFAKLTTYLSTELSQDFGDKF